MASSSLQEARTLPFKIYGAMDIRPSVNGGVEITVPKTPGGSASEWLAASPFGKCVGIPLIFFVLLGDRLCPMVEARIGIAPVVYFILWMIVHWRLTAYAIRTDERFLQYLEVRPDGLTVNRAQFFYRSHLNNWVWWRKPVKGTEDDWTYTFEIQYGTREMMVFDDIDEPAAKLISKRFDDITRRVWAREN